MKKSRITELLKTNDLVIPNSLLMNYKELKISEKELMLMAYLMSFDDLIVFDPAYFSKRWK